MRKYLVAVSLLFVLPTFTFAQWRNSLGADEAGFSGGMRTVPMPDVPSTHPPFLKGPMPLSQTWDPNIAAFGNSPDGITVTCFAEDSDNLYIGGDFRQFDTVGANFIVHYNRKTKVWNALDVGVANTVNALALHNGKLYVGGNFIHAGSGNSVVNFIAMWDGGAWTNLGGGMDNTIDALAFIGDTLYAGGNFTQAGGNPASFLAFWDGHTWQEAFGGTSYPVRTLLATHDSLFVGGNFTYVGAETSTKGLVAHGTALLHDGSWTTFGGGFYTSSFALYHDTLWAGGDYFGTPDNTLVNCIAYWSGTTWTPIGMDTMVGTNATGSVYQLLTLGDTLLAVGNFSMMAGVNASGLALLHSGQWSQLAGGIYGAPYTSIPFDGKIYVGGRFTKAGSVDANAVAALTAAGSWSPVQRMVGQYIGWESDRVRAIVTTPRYVFIGGNFTTIAGKPCNHVAAWDKQSSAWSTLGAGVDGDVDALAVQGDNLIVGGDFAHAGTVPTRNIAMCNISTKAWSAMGDGAHRTVGAIATNGSNVYASVYNVLSNGQWYDYLGKWDGAAWSLFSNGTNAGFIDVLAWVDSTLYAGGSFYSSDDGTVLNGIARIRSGGVWNPLRGGLSNPAYALAVSNDSLFVGGSFAQVDGVPDTALAEWNGNDWDALGTPGFNGPVLALAADGTGGVYAGGNFSEVAQVGRGNLVHWNGSKFGTVGSGVNNTVEALGIDNVALYAGGWFEEAGSIPTTSLHFGALDGAGAGVNEPTQNNSVLLSIYPNPASAASTVSFDLAKPADVRIELFNAIGSRVTVLADSYYSAGHITLPFDASKLSSGMYFLRLTSDGVVNSRSFVVEQK